MGSICLSGFTASLLDHGPGLIVAFPSWRHSGIIPGLSASAWRYIRPRQCPLGGSHVQGCLEWHRSLGPAGFL
ncbi:hypothetical protein BJX64DRAFT_272250 [Aspergillus heterothallicus]